MLSNVLATLMILPPLRYLATIAENKWVRWALTGGLVLSVVSVIGSYSRGALVGMVVVGLGILDPAWFYPAALLICALVSLSIGSSWTTAGTVGLALIGIAQIDNRDLPGASQHPEPVLPSQISRHRAPQIERNIHEQAK